MDHTPAIEKSLVRALKSVNGDCPPKLYAAMDHAVFPGGARIRPVLCLRVHQACGGKNHEIATAVAAAIELLHCASLVHDDLPCFDDAQARRGKPSVHKAYGEQLAVLAGDALIVLAFDTVSRAAARQPELLAALLRVVTRGVGAGGGIIAGQAWESEEQVDLAVYHRAKTAALFEAAIQGGAVAAGHQAADWQALGVALGRAYQVADDLHDVAGEAESSKGTGRDLALGRPNAAIELGMEGALEHLNRLRAEAITALPDYAHSDHFVEWLNSVIHRLVPFRLRDRPEVLALLRSA